MATVYLAVGTNLGSREDNISRALESLKKKGVLIQACSSVIETDPVGGPPQNKFLNAVLKGKTDLSPEELLEALQTIERDMGRIRGISNGPRIIDLDILLYDGIRCASETLTIPHPRMWERSFVTKPLLQIAPHLKDRIHHENHHNHTGLEKDAEDLPSTGSDDRLCPDHGSPA